jgi:hypothetical protein
MTGMRVKLAGLVIGWVVACAACPMIEIAWAQEAADPDAPKPPPPEEKPSAITKIASYGLSIAGTFVVAALVVYTLSRTLKYEQARNAIVHLLRTAPNQAEMQCRTLPYSFAEPIGHALKTGAMIGTNDLAMIQQTTAPTYDAMCTTVVQHWKGLLGKAKLATAAVLAAIVIKPGPVPIVLGVIATAGLVWMWFYKAEVDRSIFRAKVEVLPDVDRALAEGRYYVPPKQ